MLEVEGLSVAYERGWVFENISFSLSPGLYALMGLNGSGKTTLLYALAGIIPHFIPAKMRGRIRVYGKPPKEFKAKHFVFQEVEDSLIMPTVGEELRDKRLLKLIGLEGKEDYSISSLSYGEKHRLAIAVGIANRAKLLLLDEALNGLDCPSLSAVWNLLRIASKEAIVLFSTHRRELAKNADDVLILHKGQLLRGKNLINSLSKFSLDC